MANARKALSPSPPPREAADGRGWGGGGSLGVSGGNSGGSNPGDDGGPVVLQWFWPYQVFLETLLLKSNLTDLEPCA